MWMVASSRVSRCDADDGTAATAAVSRSKKEKIMMDVGSQAKMDVS